MMDGYSKIFPFFFLFTLTKLSSNYSVVVETEYYYILLFGFYICKILLFTYYNGQFDTSNPIICHNFGSCQQ